MAIFHLHVKHIGKSNNRSAVAASAYCSASKLMEESMDSSTGARCAITHNYTHKAGVVFSRIFTPEKASLWMGDREALWNLVQNRFDTRKNAVYAQEIDIALPVELSLEANKELVCEFVETVLVNEGMIADVNIHMDDIKNPHAHIMMSTREIIPGEGEDYIFGKKVRYWDSREFLVHVRRMWAASINKYLLINGFDIEVSHLSYAQRGLSIIPSVKEGVKTTIIGSRRVQKNNNIKLQNIERIRNSPDLLIDMLRRNKAAFTRDEIVRELSKFYDAHGADASEFMRALSHVMSSKKLVMLNSRNLEGELLYTDRQRFELEEDFLKIVNRLCNEEGDSKYNLGIEFQDLEEESKFQQLRKTALKKIGFERNHPKLSDKQKQVALGILNGGMVSVLEGLPGAGKTSVMREVVFQYKRYGYDVVGTAVSSSAASELGEVVDTLSYNTTKLRYEMDKLSGSDWKLNLPIDYWNEQKPRETTSKALLHAKSVLIIDEASMIDLTEMHFFLLEIEKAGAKLILLGDTGQLSSIGIKGAFEKIGDAVGRFRLSEAKRQIDAQHRKATEYLAEYKIADSIKIYKDSGAFIFSENKANSELELVRDFVARYLENKNKKNQSIVALSYTNESIYQLNHLIRENLKEYGVIYGQEVAFKVIRCGEIRTIFFAKGDKIVFNKNDNQKGIFNGDTGEIIGFGRSGDGRRKTIKIELARDKNFIGIDYPFKVEIDNLYYQNMDYGFAVNIYKSQGRTYDSVYALMDEHVGYHSFNVIATRHRELLKLYANDDILEASLYHKIELDPRKAKAQWSIKANQADMRYAAIIALVMKRDDRSFAEDYNNLALDEDASFISEYIEVRNVAIKLRNLVHEHKVGKDELKLSIAKRTKIAEQICDNYEQYRVILAQVGINYDTIEKHAGRNKYQYFFEPKNTGNQIIKTSELEQFIEQCLKLQKCEVEPLFNAYGIGTNQASFIVKEIHNITKNIILNFEEAKLDIEKIKLDLEVAKGEKQEAKIFISKCKEFVDSSIKHFIGATYKDPSDIILAEWERIILEYGGVKNALAKIAQKPEILGKMQCFGLGRILAFSKKRLVATSNSYIISERLALYEEYKEKIPNIRHDLEKGKYEEKIFELSSKIKKLEKALPSTQLEAFIQEAHMMSDIHSKPKELEVIKSMIFWAKKSSFSFIPVPHSVIPAKVGIEHYDSWITAFAGMTSGIQPKFSFDDVSQNLHQRHIEGIFRAYIHSINPDANIEKKGKRIKAGSLEMNLENGLWHRFSTNQGGNIFGFVTEATGLNKKSALEIVAEYAGVGGVPVSSPRTVIVRSLKSDAAIHPCQWIAQSTKRSGRNDGYAGITMMAKAPEFEPKKHIAYLLKTNNLDSIYTYKNMDGEIIGHTIRLINKATGSKQVIPASFCHNKALDKSEWRLKGFLDESDSKPIYGREKLQNNLKPVLIVEGEKTSDKASKLFPEYIVVSWLGGAQNADKVNWSILARNQVVIWPDFDKPGIIAARIIANRVKVPFGSISIVDVSNLGLPAKWDLGDELPHGMSMEDIRTSITDAQYKYSITGFAERMLDPDIQEIEKRILLQNRISGFILHEKELAASIQLENKIHAKLASDEAISYIKYATARSITDSDHEFLSLYHELYKDTLIEIAKANINKIDLEQNIPDLLNDLQKEYSRQKGSFTAHLSYIKPYSNTEKTEFSTILLRDILLLHEMQMSSKLSDLHKEIIAKNIYKIVDSSKDHDKLKLASEAYHQCSNSSFWSDLLEVTFDIEISRDKFELIKPIETDLDMGFGVKKLAIKNIDRSLEKE